MDRNPAADVPGPDESTPIRSGYLDDANLYATGNALAKLHTKGGAGAIRGRAPSLTADLAVYFSKLRQCYNEFNEAVAQSKEIAPAAEWLVDNFSKVEQHSQQVMQDLPGAYSRRLPRVAEGPHLGRPRIYEIAWLYLAHTDSRFSAQTSTGFITAYQDVVPLTIGELWAFAIHVRALLVENAARTSLRTLVSQQARDRADELLEQALQGHDIKWNLDAEFKKFPAHAQHSFLVHLLRRLRDRSNLDPRYLAEVLARLSVSSASIDEAITEENARQAANNLTMQNIFKSFTTVAELDWEEWFSSVSLVEQRLAASSIYASLDSTSKTLYRNAIEDLARHSSETELMVTDRAMAEAEGEPGQFLLGRKRKALEEALGYRETPLRRLRRGLGKLGLAGYLTVITLLTLLFTAFALSAAGVSEQVGSPLLLLLGLLVTFPAGETAVALVNYTFTQVLRPVVLPGFSFKSGITADHKAIIAVPTMISSFHGIEELIDQLEDHFLSNRDANLYYALLSDWNDSDVELEENDAALLSALINGIEQLNARHETRQFMLFHRKRQWNAAEGLWMGWERKRGKLHELNRILRGDKDTSFIEVPLVVPRDIIYVIVLDADTQLPAGTARQLVGKMAHPLNHPLFDAESGRVSSGYGIMQPRVTIKLPETGGGSLYRRISAHNPGLDPYVFSASDVYQDVFGEGSFTGKGIYHIDAMEAAMKDRVPDNTLLSHDLFEGNFARTGFASDTQVVEDFPDRYLVDMARHHRWTRGDWQLLRWMVPPVHGLTALGWWKMADNLRRSLVPMFTLAALIVSWLLLPPAGAMGWTAYLVVMLFIPVFLPVVAGSSLRKEAITMGSEFRTTLDDIGTAIVVIIIDLTTLVHQSSVQASAIVVTLYRMLVSRRHLLEWTTAAQVGNMRSPGPGRTFLLMWASPAFGLLLLAFRAATHVWPSLPPLSNLSLPFAFAWLLAPLVAYRISEPDVYGITDGEVSTPDAISLRRIALATWRYFDEHVTASNNMLPPDNLQEHPAAVVANRTSPTNIGVYLLSTVSACDMGWIGIDDAAIRVSATLDNMRKLETHGGHLLNWHDTISLRPLEPRYVSSVDSGNLAGHLIAAANALEKWTEVSAISPARLGGLCDCARMVDESVAAMAELHRRSKEEALHIHQQIEAFIKATDDLITQIELVPLRILSLNLQINAIGQSALRLMNHSGEKQAADCEYWMAKLRQATEAMTREATRDGPGMKALGKRLRDIAQQCRTIAYGMDFRFLFNPQRQLLSIGYRVGEESLDEGCYDLFASEATLTSFFAIAKGDLDVEHWHKLGRPVTEVNQAACLVSWSGSMFEYLMPHIVMRAPTETLYHQTLNLVVKRQMAYGRDTGTPWGISESAYAARDLHKTYQYSSFGVPGLGLKRGLGENLVIAPYATGLAAMIDPNGATGNYRRLAKCGGMGRYGFFEALDYTPERLPSGQKLEVIRAYFAHHQGMTITSIHNAVSGGQLRSYFHTENTVRAAELLLQERAPHHLPVKTVTVADVPSVRRVREVRVDTSIRLLRPRTLTKPATALYSNGRMNSMIAADGSGYVLWNGIAINRWRQDLHGDAMGLRLMLRRGSAGALHPLFYNRFSRAGDSYAVSLHQDKAEFFSHHSRLECAVEYFVSPDSDAEVRRIAITNRSDSSVTLELTSFMELALAHPEADISHPAFSKLFVHTEFDEEAEAVLATRQKRLDSDPSIWTGHFLLVEGKAAGGLQFETDRSRFLGRGNCFETADAFRPGWQWTGGRGFVLDPAVAFRQSVSIQPHDKARIYLWTVAAATREQVLALVRRHRSSDSYERIRTLAWTHARISLRHISISPEEAVLYQALSANLVYSLPDLRPAPDRIAAGMGPQTGLWQFAISGNRPIVLVRIDDANDLGVVQQLLKAQDYWNHRGLVVDLVVLNDSRSSYMQDLQWGLDDLAFRARARRSSTTPAADEQIFLLRSTALSPETINAIVTAAHIVLVASHGPLRVQVTALASKPLATSERRTKSQAVPGPRHLEGVPQPVDDALLFFNGHGGFDRNSNEYVMHHQPGRALPAPWINVIANEQFGTHCSAEGGGYTWFGNSKEQQITPWSNDPVVDSPSECLFVRQVNGDSVSSPTVQPLGRRAGRFTTRHGFGHSIYEAEENGLKLQMTVTVDAVRACKLSRLAITNTKPEPLRLAVSYLGELAMGPNRPASAHFITTEIDGASGALFMQNRWNASFGQTVIYCVMLEGQDVAAANRAAVMGPTGTIAWPEGLLSPRHLKPEVGGGYDPCMALQKDMAIAPGETVECTVLLGAAADREGARKSIAELRASGFVPVWQEQKRVCTEIVGRIRVETPDRSFDTLMNGWLLYQTLIGRFFARSGFYQASGAYGFRDQLQDTMAITYVRPDLARQHILRAASRQFIEGDVQHWWLPETGAGVRTHISDDTAWLAYCTAHYIEVTGDVGVLDEPVSFLEGRAVAKGEHDAFYIPRIAEHKAPLYEHCVLALSRNLPTGAHGLPLMGTGDWNDGMNKVGEKGQGESVWLGWFLCATLSRFRALALARKDAESAKLWSAHLKKLTRALESKAWDGNWYRRAFFDDGTSLGTAASDECRIDSIAQSWSVLAGVADPARAKAALLSVDEQLIDEDAGLARLFTPPLVHHVPNAGYIQSYPPGVRENGGQYTHGALWAIYAFAGLGDAERANRLFSLINPINHALNHAAVESYKVEPYVIAADIYGASPYTGRGGWTWYTGAAGWFYRAGLEAILGLKLAGPKLTLNPCIPASWPGFSVTLQFEGKTIRLNAVRGQVPPASGKSFRVRDAIDLRTLKDGETISLLLPVS